MEYDFFDAESDRKYQEQRQQLKEKREKEKREKSKRRTKLLIVAFIVVLAIVAIFVVHSSCQSRAFNNVDDLVVEKTTENNTTVSWESAPLAEGYIVYCLENGSTQPQKTTVQGGEKTSVEIKLEQSKAYKISVAAYRDGGKIVGQQTEGVMAYTPPVKQTVQAHSVAVGRMDISWKSNTDASVYEIQYSQKGDFSNAQSKTFSDVKTISFQIRDLTPESKYFVRARSILKVGETTVNGQWSDAVGPVEILKKLEVDPNKPMVALTFDDGPGFNGASDSILDTLEKYGARATFFMVGTNAYQMPENIKRKVALGCEIGNHTYDHEYYGESVTPESIRKCSEVIREITGKNPTCFRSCGGNTTENISQECERQGMPLYFWSIDTNDWKYRDADAVYNETMSKVEDGDIVLLHEIYESTAQATARIVPDLLARGFQLVTVSQLVLAKTGEAPVPGREYITANQLTSNSYR